MRREITVSIFAQLDGAFEFIDKHNRTRADFTGSARVDTRDYPVEALREALLNAVVHRDYSFSSPALVSMFDDRIEFVTIGGLVRGISMSDVMLGVSQATAGIILRELTERGVLILIKESSGRVVKYYMK